MNCPRCKTAIAPLADPDRIVTCPGCGSRLMTRSAALRSQGSKAAPQTSAPPPQPSPPLPPAEPAPSSPPPGLVPTPELPPSATLPPTHASQFGLPRPAASGGGTAVADTLAQLVREVRALRAGQEQILALLSRGVGTAPPPVAFESFDAADAADALSPIRASRRKSVLLVDDDPVSRGAAVAELQQADVPVRAFDNGSAALSGIAEEKPDLIVLELALGGEMGGKDLINVIKATMEWVDVPVVLWTREPISNQKEARQIHGADEIVPKSAGAGALLARVITIFRRT